MSSHLRPWLLPSLLVTSLALPVLVGRAQSTTPEQAALTKATAISDPEAMLAALENIRTDYPNSALLTSIDRTMLSTLVSKFPDRIQDVTTVFERMIARIPADASPDMRLSSTLTPVSVVVPKLLLLDRSEALVTQALAGLSLDKYLQTQADLAKRANRPEPPRATLELSYNNLRGRGLYQLARIDMARAEVNLKESVAAMPAYGSGQQDLVALYLTRNDYASAEAVLKDSLNFTLKNSPPALSSRPAMALVDVYVKKGDTASAEALLKETLKTNPTLGTALVALARIEDKRGDSAAALDHYLTAATAGPLTAADNSAAHELFRKAHGSDAGYDDALDKLYEDKFPNPVTAEPYKPTPARTDRVVLLELFTGAGCGPCVSADLALDAVMKRYPATAIVPIAYHENIPQPDPMVTAMGNSRRDYYAIRGVPTFNIDGALGQLGGGARAQTQSTYSRYIPKIDKALEAPAGAAINLMATGDGDQINVTAHVSKISPNARDLRLHLLLVEHELRYTGENGIRFHPMVVRAMAGDRGGGIPITSDGTTKYTFNLAAVRDDVTKTLAAEIEKRRKSEVAGSTPRVYAAEDHPYTAINPAALAVVAFVQEGAYAAAGAPDAAAGVVETVEAPPATGVAAAQPPVARPPAPAAVKPGAANVLQAAKVDVIFAASTKKGGGGRR